jgi:hypothetical protein
MTSGTTIVTIFNPNENKPPVLADLNPNSADNPTFIGGSSVVTLLTVPSAPAHFIADPDGALLSKATVTITAGYLAGVDFLNAITSGGNIGVSYTDGVLELTGIDTIDNYEAVLRTAFYGASPADATNGDTDTVRTLSWVVYDQFNAASNVDTTRLNVGINDAPVLHGVPVGAAYAGGPAVILAPGLTISDVDSATLISATVHVGAGASAGHGEVLSVDAVGLAGTNILASYDAAGETLTLSGDDTPAHYSQALEHVAFETTNFGFDRARTIEWQVNDGSSAHNLSALETTGISMPGSPPNDFGATGHSGLLWQNADGTPAIWTLDGTSLVSKTNVGFNPGAAWHTIGAGDFNGDGQADILWQNADGTPAVWLMNGTGILSGANVGFNPGSSWHVIGSGDFDGDGKADILWQNSSGQAAVWLMDGLAIKSGSDVGPNPGPSWHVLGSGDFNGDGKADILWQNANGQAAVWLMDGQSLISGANVGFNPGADWHVQGAGDFNGDGKADILWQNANGQAAVWEMNGLNLISGSNVGFNPGPAWQVHGAGDFNGDGKADIEWQNVDGTAAVWLMDGYNVVSGSNVGANPGASWHVVPAHHDALV